MLTKNKALILLYSFLSLSILLVFWIGIFDNYDPNKKINQQINSSFAFQIDNDQYITNKDLKQKNILLYFWASWCDSCAEEMKIIEKQWEQHKILDYIFVGVNIFDDYSNASNFIRKNGITFPISYNNNNKAIEFGLIGVPETIFISKNMQITKKIIGPFDEKELIELLKEINTQ
ncbi:MAG: hypothetical protein CL779_02910 [Chloroflexi bacterium]|nr:hypothetical protein [Chloroflexota bacterium]|tara:strand:+ start:3600 stop:4124 length:525 start_codon:yes stop_codon:yes gene_type:complete